MKKKEKLEIVQEIRKIEQQLYLKRSELASAEAMEYDFSKPSKLADDLDAQRWHKVFSELIEKIGQLSDGGDSVEDIREQRER